MYVSICAEIDGSIIAVRPDPSVSTSVLIKIFNWLKSGILFNDIIDTLRCRTVPQGHIIHSWKKGKNILCALVHVCV